MIQTRRLAHATFSTTDLERQIEYWSEVIGLSVVQRSKDRALFATREGLECIALEKGPDAGRLLNVAFQIDPEADLGELESRLRDAGVRCERRSDLTPGVRSALAFHDPKGTLVEVFAQYQFAPDTGVEGGIQPVKFGHVAYRVNDPQKLTDFYCEMLGFRVSDWMGDHFSFLRCGVDHHTINFVRFPEEKLHHIAFELRDVGEVRNACDYLARKKIPLVWGPGRHIVGHNIAAYHRNPDEIRVELFTELDMMKDEALGYWEPRPWHEERPLRPKMWPKETWRSQWGFGSFGTFPGYP